MYSRKIQDHLQVVTWCGIIGGEGESLGLLGLLQVFADQKISFNFIWSFLVYLLKFR